MLRVQVVIFDGFDELDAIAPYEVLQTAAATGASIQAELVTLSGAQAVIAAHGTQVQPHTQVSVDQALDVLVVPGGGWSNRAAKGAWAEAQQGELPAAIAQLHRNGTTIASVCTGTMLVAAAGLLKGRPAITHHGALEDLKAAGAEVINARVVDDGDIVSAGGVTSGLDLALWLIERYFSPEAVYEVEKELEYERRGTVWRRSAGQR